jgi:hypothetical protein
MVSTITSGDKLAGYSMHVICSTVAARPQFFARYLVSYNKAIKIQFNLKNFKRDGGFTMNTSRSHSNIGARQRPQYGCSSTVISLFS